jgi:hypothetical protein
MKALLAAAVVAVALPAATAATVPAAERAGPVKMPHLVGLSRTSAEARLARTGLRSLLPTREAERYEAISPPAGPVDWAIPESQAPDRTVVAQEPVALGQRVARGDFIPFSTVLPPDSTRRGAYVFPTAVDHFAIAADRRSVRMRFRALARRCQPLDHVDIGLGRRFVAIVPSVTGTQPTQDRCPSISRRVAEIELPESAGDRVVIDGIPTRPHRGLYRIRRSPFLAARSQPEARAVALDFGHGSGCGLLAGTRVRETKRTVRITLLTGDAGASGQCTADFISDMTLVTLKRPLGDRRLIDGATSRPARRH